MNTFYSIHNLKKSGEGPGGKFNGPSIKYILREENLSELEESLPEILVLSSITSGLFIIFTFSAQQDILRITT